MSGRPEPYLQRSRTCERKNALPSQLRRYRPPL